MLSDSSDIHFPRSETQLGVNGLQDDMIYFILHQHLQDETALRVIEREPAATQTRLPALGEELADGNETSVDVKHVIDTLKFSGNSFFIHTSGELEGSGAVGANRTALGCSDSTRNFNWDVVM